MPYRLNRPTVSTTDVLRPTHLRVSLATLSDNLASIQRAVGQGVRVMPILKSNAYGHGLVPVARKLASAGAHMFGVAYLEEALLLRRAGIDTPILVLGGIVGHQIPVFIEYGLTLTASSIDKLLAIEQAAAMMGARASVHLKIDTGMERIGTHWYSATPLLEASLQCRHVDVGGIYSHFANSDADDLTHARLQLERFSEVLAFYPQHNLPMPCRHIANSGGILQLPESHLDMVRPGILLYGVSPLASRTSTVPVRPALCWQSRVVYFKVVKAGNPVSYGSTWAPTENTRVVTVPVGYGDGYFRALSGKAQVQIGGKRYPVVGRICMDQLMVDIGEDSAHNGDEVILLGEGGPHPDELADWAGTIAYEVLTNINTRVPRVYVDAVSPDATTG